MAYKRINTTDGVTIMNKKLYDNLQDGIEERGVTPEMFGAIGDGITDDSEAINKAIESSSLVYFGLNKVYKICNGIRVRRKELYIEGNNSVILVDSSYNPLSDDKYGVIRLEISNETFIGNNLTLDISSDFKQTSMMYGLYSYETNTKMILNNFNILFSELEGVHRHCLTFIGEYLSMENCKLVNKTKDTVGGCLWIHSDHDDCYVDIKGSEFINYSSDEIFASYGTGTKHINCFNSSFYTDSQFLKKSTIMFAFYEGGNFVNFKSCSIKQIGGNSNNENSLYTLIRGGDPEGNEVSIKFDNCLIHSELKTGMFTTTNNLPLGNFHINLEDCFIQNTLGPIVGSWSIYEDTGSKGALPACYVCFSSCRIKCLYAVSEGSNNTRDIYKVILQNCIIFITNARRVFYSYYNNNMMIRLIDTFIETDKDIQIIQSRHSSISGDSHYYKSFASVENSFLNGEAITLA